MMAIARGMVVKPPTTVSANPAAFIASLLSPLEINKPMPVPSAIRVPVQRIISGKVMFRSIMVPPQHRKMDENFRGWMRGRNDGIAKQMRAIFIPLTVICQTKADPERTKNPFLAKL